MKRVAWYGLMGLVAVAGLVWIWAGRLPGGMASGSAASALPPAPAIGHPAPDFELATADGQRVRLSSLRGKPVVLNFWATWCPPCRGELPQLQAASQRDGASVAFVGVDQMEPAASVTAMARDLGLSYPLPLDISGTASRAYAVRSLPTTYFIDREGIIRQIQIGGLTEATLADALRSIYP